MRIVRESGARCRWLAAALALGVLAGCAGHGAGDGPPNLVIVLVDTVRADHLGYHGYGRETSPRIDAFAARSQAFLQHYSTSSRTEPAVASIFTGLFPRSHGVLNPLTRIDAKGILRDEHTTLAEILTASGYDCYGYVANFNVSDRFGFAQGFADYAFCESAAAPDLRQRASAVLAAARERPFFLYLHYMEPHSHYAAPAKYRSLWVDPDYRGATDGSQGQLNEIVTGRRTLAAADLAQLEAYYDQEIRYVDDEFAMLLDEIEARGLHGRTIVVFVADHGEEFLDHGSALHGYTLYEEQLHVPLVIHDPRRRDARRIEATSRHVDLLPTLLDLLGLPRPALCQGQSLVPLLDERPAAPGEVAVLAEGSLRAAKTVRLQSLAAGGWKVIRNVLPAATVELYHLAEDPAERNDLAAREPQVTQRMLARLDEVLAGLPAAEGKTTALSDDEIRRLRSLGYVR
ncbi:MAG TPA: sulfatase [Candidatus Krumholzibacteria bacterium]|nr:sulfatase [Candidatus Krumholzibacteria bacterium]HPD72247.1 sulfatase [Candidatus Krumholzibacteria bacterium]HRY40821.1 sulfatase [Candidatus Krumholzibacteria bacterium]